MRRSVAAPLAALASGLGFGAGIVTSGLDDPSRIHRALDLAGAWDASVLLVAVAALVVSGVGFALAARRARTWIGTRLELPKRRDVDARLVGGSVLLGIGWGMAGLSPGTALVAIGTGSRGALAFFGAMLVTTLVVRTFDARRADTIVHRGSVS